MRLKSISFYLYAAVAIIGVRNIFCGHTHFNAGGFYKSMQQIISAPIGGVFKENACSGFRIVHVEKEKITHEFVPLEANPQIVA